MKFVFLIVVIFVSVFSCSILNNSEFGEVTTEIIGQERAEPEEVNPTSALCWSFFTSRRTEANLDISATILQELKIELRSLIDAPEIAWNHKNTKRFLVQYYPLSQPINPSPTFPQSIKISGSTEAFLSNFENKYKEALRLKRFFRNKIFNLFREDMKPLFQEYFRKLVDQEIINGLDNYKSILLINDLLYTVEYLNRLFSTSKFETLFSSSLSKAISSFANPFTSAMISVLKNVEMNHHDKFENINRIFDEIFQISSNMGTNSEFSFIPYIFDHYIIPTISDNLPRGQVYDPALFIHLFNHFLTKSIRTGHTIGIINYYKKCSEICSKSLDEITELCLNGYCNNARSSLSDLIKILSSFGPFIFDNPKKLNYLINFLKSRMS